MVLRAHIVRVVLGGGAFDWADTRLTAAALALFIVSLTAQALSLLFVRGYYAAGETFKPLAINICTAAGIVVGGYALLNLFAHSATWRFFVEDLFRVEGIPGTEVLMLPLSYALFSILNIVIFIFIFERDFSPIKHALRKTFFESFSAAVVAGFTAHQSLRVLDDIFSIDTFFGVFAIGMFAGILGILAGIVVLHLLGSKELQEVSRALHHKFWRRRPIFSGGTERGTEM